MDELKKTLLYEYGDWGETTNPAALKKYLQDIWQNRLLPVEIDTEDIELDENAKDIRYQPFLQIDGKDIRAQNYIGFIQNGEELIEIYPKVFRDIFKKPTSENKKLMLQHILFWFNYCHRWKFPFNKASLSSQDIDSFPELIIHLIVKQLLQTIQEQPLMLYQEVEEALTVPKGRINFSRYINNSLSHGNYNLVECDYEPFLYDNQVNRIIKYCARLLMGQTRLDSNMQLLQEVLFVLDEVEDVVCTAFDVDKVRINSFYEEYLSLMELCRIVLLQQVYDNEQYNLSQWCLLLPMEYVFEDFVAGFLEKHFSAQWKIEYQKSDKYLCSKPSVFQIRHDIFLTSKLNPTFSIIIDTKYKLRAYSDTDNKKGVAQADLYQMVSYAYRRNCQYVFLLYPNLCEMPKTQEGCFDVEAGNGSQIIHIYPVEVPFWQISVDNLETELRCTLQNCLANIK